MSGNNNNNNNKNDTPAIANNITTDNTVDSKNNNNNETEVSNNNNIKCTFKKPVKQRGNIRKRSDDLILNTTKNNDDDDDDEGDDKNKKKLKSKINQYTTKQDKKNEFSYDSTGNAGSSVNSAELSTTEYLNEEDEYQDKVIKNSSKSMVDEQQQGSSSSSSNDDGIYRGMKSYSTFVEKKSDLSYKGGGVKAGPIKTSTTVRLSSRIDHQPDVCKDYKQTGQCTFGDACKFLHDRTDYKSGWQIDKEYEEEQKLKRLNNIKGISSSSDKKDDSNKDDDDSNTTLPFACFICKKQYNNPVQTKCKHFFCEDCALSHNRKNKKCALCNEPTGGTFTTPPKKLMDQLMDISKSHFSKLN